MGNWLWSQQFFPMSLVLADDGEILQASDGLKNKFSGDIIGRNILSVFDVARPRVNADNLDLASRVHSLFLMNATDNSIAVRSQLCRGDYEGEERFFLMGAPWLSWIKQNAPTIDLDAADFPVHDAQLEQEFLMNSQQDMLGDLEELTDNLRDAKDQAQQADKAKSDFVSHVSHEMRTPLNGVVSAVNLLGKESLPTECQQLVEIASASSAALMDVINEVLDFSRISSGSMSFENVDFSPTRLVKDAVLMLSSSAQNKGIGLQVNYNDDIPPALVGDAEKIRQVLVNLIGNAIKYSDDGEVTVKATSSAAADDSVSIRFEVADQGRGIGEEDQKWVFEPFWCKGAGLGVNESSTGLGLSICSQIIDKMNGSMGLSSKVGEGSVFWFELQLPVGEAQQEDLEVASATKQEDKNFAGRILLVDDNAVNLTLGKLLIERHGLEVSCASDGAEAVEKATSGNYDLVFMDIKMPVMDGVEATEKLRQQFTQQQLPIVALTANVSEVDKKRYLETGMNNCLTKPIIEDEMLKILAEWVGVSESNTEAETSEGEQSGSAAEQSSDPVIDKAVLDKLKSDVGEANLAFVTEQLFGEAEKRMQSLFQAQNDDDVYAIGREAHALGSSMLGFGAQRFGIRLRKIEAAANDEDINTLHGLLGDVDKEYQHTVEELQQYMASN